jgi:D-alanyl-D-alanine dipeptidase
VNVVVGKSGLGWGIGIRNVPRASGPIKKEGDGKAPAGIFRLSATFGYAPAQPSAWKMPYIALTKSVECVDDPRSKFYNRIVDRSSVSPDWNSSEHMLLGDERYQWGMVVDHNSANKARSAIPGAGSCIFLHIWRDPETTTVGCTAMSQADIETMLAWLDPMRSPILVQLPEAQYKSLRKSWKLPNF